MPACASALQVSPVVLDEMRRGCDSAALVSASAEAVGRLLRLPASKDGDEEEQQQQQVLSALRPHLMPPSCPLFARKVAADSVGEWAALLRPVMAGA